MELRILPENFIGKKFSERLPPKLAEEIIKHIELILMPEKEHIRPEDIIDSHV